MFHATPFEYGRFAELHRAGWSTREIAAHLGCSRDTVLRYAAKFRAHGMAGLCDGRKNNVGQRKTTPAQDAAIAATMRRDTFQSAGEIIEELHLGISEKTVRRRLRGDTLKNRIAAEKIDTEAHHEARRVEFALECLPITPEEWSTVIFTDEKVFSSDKDSRRTVWREDGTRYEPQNVKPLMRSGRVTAAFWGWVSAAGPGEIHEIDRAMNAREYIRILEEVMIPSVRALYPVEEMPIIRIVEDNSAVHRAGIVRQWYAEHPEVQRFDWPAKSPDLNPIENVWSEMGRGWRPVRRERKEGLCRRVRAA